MEATATASTTGSQTIADLIPRAAAEHAEQRRRALQARRRLARRHLRAAGGDRPGDRPRADRPRHRSPASASASSPTPARVVLRRHGRHLRRRGRRADLPDQLARGVPVGDLRLGRLRDRLRERGAAREDRRDPRPAAAPAHGHRDRPAARRAPSNGSAAAHPSLEAITLEEVRERGRTHSADELEARRAAVRPEDPFTFIYTSGTTGPPKGCVLTHGNYRAIIDMICEAGEIQRRRGHLPVPAARALLRAADPARRVRPRQHARYFGGDTKQIIPELLEVKPTYLPSVPRIFEKIYTLAHGAIEAQSPEEQERAQAAIELGVKVRDMMTRGEAGPGGAAEALRGSRRAAVQERARDLRRASAPRRPAAPRRSRTRSSSSSGPAACPCSRATA